MNQFTGRVLLIALLSGLGLAACSEQAAESKAPIEAAANMEPIVGTGPLAYVPNEKDGNVSIIDTANDTVLETIPR